MMNIVMRRIFKKWQKEKKEAERNIGLFIKQRNYSAAQREQTKATWIEHCIIDLKEANEQKR